MKTLKMMIGLPGSGKTSYAKKYLMNNNTVYLSSDQIRIDMFGYEDQNHNDKVFERMKNETLEAISQDFDVIYDATNLSKKRRADIIKKVQEAGGIVEAYLLCTPIDVILERNLMRQERIIPWDKLQEMIKSIECPMYYENFAYIYLVDGGFTDDIYNYNVLIEKCESFIQDNPYHQETLKEHIEAVAQEAEKISDNPVLIRAARYHDFGKLYTKTYNEKKGHYVYYGHEKISTYLFLCHLRKQDFLKGSIGGVRLSIDEYYTAALNLNHMEWYRQDDMTKIEQLFAQDEGLFDLLTILHEADINGRKGMGNDSIKDENKIEENKKDEQKIERIDVVFENCEVYSLTPDMIVSCGFNHIYKNIGINYFQYEDGEVFNEYNCQEFFLIINRKGEQARGSSILSDEKVTFKERIQKGKDITHVDIMYEDGSNQYIQLPWGSISEYTNDYLTMREDKRYGEDQFVIEVCEGCTNEKKVCED